MDWSKSFVELDKQIHDRDSFDSGEPEINHFIKTMALRHMKLNISKTMVLPALSSLPTGKYPISSFYTIAPGTIDRNFLPKNVRKKLPFYPIPVFIIAQMGVHSKCQKRGLGRITIVNALEYLYTVNSHMRAYAVIVDCLNNEIEQFYFKFGFEYFCKHNDRTRLFLPMKTIEQIFCDR